MHFIMTEEMIKAQQEASQRQWQQALETVRRRAEAIEAWEKSHPPCPHCGRRDPVPWVLQYGDLV